MEKKQALHSGARLAHTFNYPLDSGASGPCFVCDFPGRKAQVMQAHNLGHNFRTCLMTGFSQVIFPDFSQISRRAFLTSASLN